MKIVLRRISQSQDIQTLADMKVTDLTSKNASQLIRKLILDTHRNENTSLKKQVERSFCKIHTDFIYRYVTEYTSKDNSKKKEQKA
jgi:hypothetical protein